MPNGFSPNGGPKQWFLCICRMNEKFAQESPFFGLEGDFLKNFPFLRIFSLKLV